MNSENEENINEVIPALNSEIKPKTEIPDDLSLLNLSNQDSNELVPVQGDREPPIIFAGPDDDFGALLAEHDISNNLGDLRDVHRTVATEFSRDIFDINSSLFSTNQVKYKMVDGKSVKVWCCSICKKEFAHQYTLMRHFPTHTNERRFNCPTCGKAFRQMSTLSQHRAIHSEERPYSCEICQKTFNRISTLISHRKTHNEQKPHMCHVCNKSFHQKGNLRNHIFTHTNERPYKCEMCQKGFNQMSNLMCHKLKSHQHDEIPKYSCKICGQNFLKRIALRHHEEQHYKNVNSFAEHANNLSSNNVIIIDPIETDEMKFAKQKHQTPFAILKPVVGTPILVRVLPTGNKHMLVPATTDDIKNCGHVTVTSKDGAFDIENLPGPGNDSDEGLDKIEIKIPVVARLTSKHGPNGLYMSISSPNQNSDSTSDNIRRSRATNSCIYNPSWPSQQGSLFNVIGVDSKLRNVNRSNSLLRSDIQFLDPDEHMITEEEFNDFNMVSIANPFDTTGMALPPSNDAQSQNDGHREIPINDNIEDSAHLTFAWNF